VERGDLAEGATVAGPGGRAVVVGAGISGLLAARVLTGFFEQVTLVDRDDLAGGPLPRRGVPQGRHPHALLTGGLRALQELLPDLTADLVRHGAEVVDLQADSRLHVEGVLVNQRRSGLEAVAVSRPLLEDRIRTAVLALPRIELVAAAQLLDLRTRDGRVTGVRVRRDGADVDLPADLVVDATGRGSHTPAWLAEHGWLRPAESQIAIGIAYTVWVFARRPDDLGGARFLLTAPTADVPRFGSALAAEGDRWLVGCAAYRDDRAPLDLPALHEFTARLAAPDLGDLVRDRQPLEEPRTHRFPSSVRRHYEKLPRFPEGLLVTGDAISSFNPIYGQGMTIAALEALALRKELAVGRADLARRFFRRAARLVDVAWELAAGGDLQLPVVPGPRPLRTRLVNSYIDQVARAATRDGSVALTLIRVLNLLDPPTVLVRPGTVARVVAARRPRFRRPEGSLRIDEAPVGAVARAPVPPP
jgi:2-polyprenyl-6-methoxyphenol hydroxylase-like FAD-dependent oxidoreductase